MFTDYTARKTQVCIALLEKHGIPAHFSNAPGYIYLWLKDQWFLIKVSSRSASAAIRVRQ